MSSWNFQREVNILQFFDKYYAKLGLPPDADDAAIKSAYRRLAKQYHPDRSRDPGTREKFIEVNQAYEMLIKREAVIQQALRRHYAKKKNEKKEVQHKRDIAEEARRRASLHADMPFERFARSPIYRTAVVVAGIFDYVAIFTGLVMILAPVGSYFADMTRLAGKGEEPDFHIVPIFIGLTFLYGVWYFKKQD